MSGRTAVIIFLILMIHPDPGRAQNPDRRAVITVAEEYLDAMYEANPAKMEQCLHEQFVKNGYYWKGSSETFSDMTSISRDQLIQIAKDWNRDKWVPADAPGDIAVLDLQENIAVVKLTAYWGIEYLHISKAGSTWMIVQVLSQNWPKRE